MHRLLAAVVLAAVTAAATAAAASTSTNTTTQAGCECLASWPDASGAAHSGCANPDGDPSGEWCAVDGEKCPGRYGSYSVASTGATVFFDYCGDVRERTAAGCLCAAEWRGERGVGKAYRDRCAHPDSPKGARVGTVCVGGWGLRFGVTIFKS